METLSAEIQTRILQFAGFQVAVLFDNEYATRTTYNYEIDTLDHCNALKNVKAIKWIVNNVFEWIWEDKHDLIRDVLLQQDYKLATWLKLKGFDTTLNYWDHMLIDSQQQEIFHGVSPTPEDVIDAIEGLDLDSALELMETYDFEVDEYILDAAACNVNEETPSDLLPFITKKEDWELISEIFIMRDSVKLVRWAMDMDEFVWTGKGLMYKIFDAGSTQLLEEYGPGLPLCACTPSPFHLTQFPAEAVKEYILPRIRPISSDQLHTVLTLAIEDNNHQLFTLFATTHHAFEGVIQNLESEQLEDAFTMVNCHEMLRVLITYTWHLIRQEWKQHLLEACFGSLTKAEHMNYLYLLVTDTTLNPEAWVDIFYEHLERPHNVMSTTCQWILDFPMRNYEWHKTGEMVQLQRWFKRTLAEYEEEEHKKALVLLELLPDVVVKEHRHRTYEHLGYIYTPLLERILEGEYFRATQTEYNWLANCSINQFIWAMKHSDPEYVRVDMILFMTKLLHNYDLRQWIIAQNNLLFLLPCSKFDFYPKWK